MGLPKTIIITYDISVEAIARWQYRAADGTVTAVDSGKERTVKAHFPRVSYICLLRPWLDIYAYSMTTRMV